MLSGTTVKREFAPPPKLLNVSEFRRITQLMYERFGIDLRTGKEGLVEARLGKIMRQRGFASFGEYLDRTLADSSGGALVEMVDALTTNHTSFLREKAHFDYLLNQISPAARSGQSLSIWSAACSTGEEPYSIACTLLDRNKGFSFSILATDLSTRVLKIAREGKYPCERLADIPLAWKQSLLTQGAGTEKGTFRFRPEVIRHVDFRKLNLMEPIQHGRKFHVIFCRNVIMYFDRPTQQSVINRLTNCLEPGGYMFVGHSETLTGITHHLTYLHPAIYRRER